MCVDVKTISERTLAYKYSNARVPAAIEKSQDGGTSSTTAWTEAAQLCRLEPVLQSGVVVGTAPRPWPIGM